MATKTKINKLHIIIILILVAIGVGFLLSNRPAKTPPVIKGIFEIGQPAPDFTSIDFDGNPIKLSDYSGKAIVLDFWATWCVFCVEEMPELEAIHQESGDEVIFLGIHRTDSGENIKTGNKFAEKLGVTYTLIQDTSGEIYRAATKGLNAMPIAIYIDKEGIVQEVKLGPKRKEDIRKSVAKIL